VRPHIGDLLCGVKKTFGEVIVPALTEPFAVEQATFMMLVLDHIVARWDQAQAFHRAEHIDLRKVLLEAAEDLWATSQEHPGLRPLLEAILHRIDEEDAADRLPRTPEAIAQANAALREHVSKLLEYVEGGTEADGFPEAHGVGRACHAYMRRQLEREREWVKVGEFIW
jgi:hypothetical protein